MGHSSTMRTSSSVSYQLTYSLIWERSIKSMVSVGTLKWNQKCGCEKLSGNDLTCSGLLWKRGLSKASVETIHACHSHLDKQRRESRMGSKGKKNELQLHKEIRCISHLYNSSHQKFYKFSQEKRPSRSFELFTGGWIYYMNQCIQVTNLVVASDTSFPFQLLRH